MKCNACGEDLTPGQRFCGQCGAPVAERGRESGAARTLDALIKDYRKELEDQPDDTKAKYNLAMALEQRGRFEEALGLLRQIRDREDVQADVERVERKIAGDPRIDANGRE